MPCNPHERISDSDAAQDLSQNIFCAAQSAIHDSKMSTDFYGNDFDYSYLMWLLYVYAGDRVGEEVEKILLPHVRKDLMSNFIHWDMRLFFQPIRDLFYYGLYDSDTLFKPKDCDRSAAGLYILTE